MMKTTDRLWYNTPTMSGQREYFLRLAAAYVRGKLQQSAAQNQPELFTSELDALTDQEWQQLIHLGELQGLRLHRFKRTMELPRVQKVLGMLKGLQPTNLLDIGSGRGVFLWPLLDTFPDLPVTCLDLLEYRVSDIQSVSAGGVSNLSALSGDVTALPFADHSFDVVTVLEVLEHIPETRKALAEVCRVARRFVLFSVPSKEDDNPEHIHLFTLSHMRELLAECGIVSVQSSYVLNHMLGLARIEQS